MRPLSRQVAIGAVATLGLACTAQTAFAQSSAAPALGAPESRVRTHSPIIRALIHAASEKSKTFRGLVAAIDASDGLVYLNVGTCGRVRACFLHRVTLAGPSRVLHIVVDVRPNDLALTAAIGHELQHALEVLGDTRIRTDLDIVAFYARHGLKLTGLNGAIETDAAIAAGDAVRDELQHSRAAAPDF